MATLKANKTNRAGLKWRVSATTSNGMVLPVAPTTTHGPQE